MIHLFDKNKLRDFTQEIDQLKQEMYSSISEADFRHLLKIERWGRLSTFFGYATAWIIPNPLTAFLISLGQSTRWLLAHHILHKGYDKVPGIPARYTSRGFAQGGRRFLDWFDWIHPKAWDYEHNILHHYHTGEHLDPDLVERNAEFLRKSSLPVWCKYLFMIFFGLTWKFVYYAPNTISCLNEKNERIHKDSLDFLFLKDIFTFSDVRIRRLWIYCYAPYFIFNFILIPMAFLVISQQAAIFVLINRIMAELIANFHSFLIIGPNHAGEDLHRYDFHYEKKDEFYLTQILSSVNYNCGKQWLDYLQIWLNYQIEHHLFPDLPMLKYCQVQPKVKALCQKYDIPYIQESVFTRFNKMLQICVGSRDMLQGKADNQVSAEDKTLAASV